MITYFIILINLVFSIHSDKVVDRKIIPLDNVSIHDSKILCSSGLNDFSDWYGSTLLKKNDEFLLYLITQKQTSNDAYSYSTLCEYNLETGSEKQITKGNGNGPMEIQSGFNFNIDQNSNTCFIYNDNQKKVIIYDLDKDKETELKMKNIPTNGAYSINNALFFGGSSYGIFNSDLMFLFDDNGTVKETYEGFKGIDEMNNMIKFTGALNENLLFTTVLRYFPIYIYDNGETQKLVAYNSFDIKDPIEKLKKIDTTYDGSYSNKYDNYVYQLLFVEENVIAISSWDIQKKTIYIDCYDKNFKYIASIDYSKVVEKMNNYVVENKKFSGSYAVNNSNLNRSKYCFYISKLNEEIVYVDFLELFKANYQAVN